MTKIDGNTGTAGLLGYPVKHTKSPMIHNTLAEAYGDNLVYLPFEVEPGALGDAIRGAWALGVLGLNVTVPHKQTVMEYLTRIDPLAKALGAVNTLVREEDGFAGYNTDILGLEQALIRADIRVEGEKVLPWGEGFEIFLTGNWGKKHKLTQLATDPSGNRFSAGAKLKWTAQTSINQTGWSALITIPWEDLRIDPAKQKEFKGLFVRHFVPAKKEGGISVKVAILNSGARHKIETFTIVKLKP